MVINHGIPSKAKQSKRNFDPPSTGTPIRAINLNFRRFFKAKRCRARSGMVQATEADVRGEVLDLQSPNKDASGLHIKSYNWKACLEAERSDLKSLGSSEAIVQLQTLVDSDNREWIPVRGR
jgi:hypothetical protein